MASAFGYTPTEVDAQPAALLDWMLRIEDEKVSFQNQQYRDASDDADASRSKRG